MIIHCVCITDRGGGGGRHGCGGKLRDGGVLGGQSGPCIAVLKQHTHTQKQADTDMDLSVLFGRSWLFRGRVGVDGGRKV